MQSIKASKTKRVFLFFSVFFLLIGLVLTGLSALDNAQDVKIRKDVQNILLEYNEVVPFSEAALDELNKVFAQKPQNPIRLAQITYVGIAEHPDYPSIRREGDEEIVYEFRDIKPRFWEVVTFNELTSSEYWDSYRENSGLENIWRLDFCSSYTPRQYRIIVFGSAALFLLASGRFWFRWAKGRKIK